MNEAFSAAEQTLCGPCLEKFLEGRAEGNKSSDEISRQLHPTNCIHCATDNGDAALSTMGGMPTCAYAFPSTTGAAPATQPYYELLCHQALSHHHEHVLERGLFVGEADEAAVGGDELPEQALHVGVVAV